MSTQAVEDLKAARELIADPSKWTKGVAARDARGEKTDPRGDNAVCFCALGAICRVANGNAIRTQQAEEFLYAYLEETQPGRYITSINDSDGHEAVLDLFDMGIALAEASS